MKKLIVGNWKMNLNVHDSTLLIARLQQKLLPKTDMQVVACPSATALFACHKELAAYDEAKMSLGAQNICCHEEGAYTGEIAATQVKDLVKYTIVGHSERRIHFGETDQQISKKVQIALRYKLKPVLCVGENTKQRHDGLATQVVLDQLEEDLDMATAADLADLAVAYEPVWAIGTGEFAKPDEAEHMTGVIFDALRQKFGEKAAEKVRILYGGSVDPENSNSYMALKRVDGLLVGGASLNYQKFAEIVNNL